MSQREQARLKILNGVLERRMDVEETARILGLSERHTWRIFAAYQQEGAAALAHGNRGRRPANATSASVREQVIGPAKTTYQGLNHSHLTEILAQEAGSVLSRGTVRSILANTGIPSLWSRRPHAIVCDENDAHKRACFCNWTGVLTIGWKEEAPRLPCCWP